MCPNDADGMANSADPDQTATLFAQTCMSKNLGTLRYVDSNQIALSGAI